MQGHLLQRLFTGIPTLFLTLFFALPLGALVMVSFWRTENYHLIREWSLMNYHTLLVESAYSTFLIRSLVMAFAVSIFLVAISWPIAYFIVRSGGRYKLLLSLLFAVPFLSGEVLRLISLQGLLGPVGLVNGLMVELGGAPLRFIMYTNVATFIGLVYIYLPIVVTVIYLSIGNFDFRLVQVASIFGASPTRAFYEIVWPLNLSGTIIGFLLSFIPCLSASLAPRFLGGPDGTLYGMSMSQQFGESGTWALGAAMGVALFLLSLLLLIGCCLFVDLRRTGFTGMGRA